MRHRIRLNPNAWSVLVESWCHERRLAHYANIVVSGGHRGLADTRRQRRNLREDPSGATVRSSATRCSRFPAWITLALRYSCSHTRSFALSWRVFNCDVQQSIQS